MDMLREIPEAREVEAGFARTSFTPWLRAVDRGIARHFTAVNVKTSHDTESLLLSEDGFLRENEGHIREEKEGEKQLNRESRAVLPSLFVICPPHSCPLGEPH